MEELIRKVLKESREVKTDNFSGLEKIIIKDTEKLIKDYPYLDSVYGVSSIDVVDDDLQGRVFIRLKPELIKYMRKSNSDYDDANDFYIFYGIQVYNQLPKDLFERADIFTLEHRLEDMLEPKLGLNTKHGLFNVYFVFSPEKTNVNENVSKLKENLINQIEKNGLKYALDMTNFSYTKLWSIIGDEYLTRKIKQEFIQDFFKSFGYGINLIEFEIDPIYYNSNQKEYGEITYLGINKVSVTVWDRESNDIEGEFGVFYHNLNDDMIDSIFDIVIELYENNVDII
jgi:hypothetical protein